MNENRRLLREVQKLFETVEDNYSSSGPVKVRQERIIGQLDQLKTLITDEEYRSKLDDLLQRISVVLSDESVLREAKDYLASKPELFVEAEKPLQQLISIKKRDLQKAIEASSKTLASLDENASEQLNSAMPSSTEELLSQLEGYVQSATATLKQSMELPRKAKKNTREDEKYRLWLATTGTVLSVGNVLLSLTGLGASVAATSITAGAGCVGSAAFKPNQNSNG